MKNFSLSALLFCFACLGWLHVVSGQEIQREYQEIEAQFQEALTRFKSNPQQRLAANQLRVERLQSLVRNNASPDSLTIVDRQYLARISKSLGEIDHAIDIAKGILEDHPKDPVAHGILMSIFVERGSEGEALGAIDQSLRQTESLRLVTPYYGSLAIRMSTQSAPRSAVRYFNKFFYSSIQVAEVDCTALLPLQSTLPLYQGQYLALHDANQFSIDLRILVNELEALLKRKQAIEVRAKDELESLLVLLWATSILDSYTNHSRLVGRMNQAVELITDHSKPRMESRVAVDIIHRILFDSMIGASHRWDCLEIRDALKGWRQSINDSSEMLVETRSLILASLDQVELHRQRVECARGEFVTTLGEKSLFEKDEKDPVLEMRIGSMSSMKDPKVLDQVRLLARSGVRKTMVVLPDSKADEIESIKRIIEQEFADTTMRIKPEELDMVEITWVLHLPGKPSISCVGSSPQKAGYLAWQIIHSR